VPAELRRASARSAPDALEPDNAAHAVERALECIIESSRWSDAALEVESLDDECPITPLGLEIRAPDDPITPEKRQYVVAELSLRLRLVDLDHVIEAEDTAGEPTIPQQVVER
jgi:hypothetical protein